MAELLIHGGRRLSGRIAVGGNKNSALPLLAACLLTDETCELHNVPEIRDVAVMIALLRSLGGAVGVSVLVTSQTMSSSSSGCSVRSVEEPLTVNSWITGAADAGAARPTRHSRGASRRDRTSRRMGRLTSIGGR